MAEERRTRSDRTMSDTLWWIGGLLALALLIVVGLSLLDGGLFEQPGTEEELAEEEQPPGEQPAEQPEGGAVGPTANDTDNQTNETAEGELPPTAPQGPA